MRSAAVAHLMDSAFRTAAAERSWDSDPAAARQRVLELAHTAAGPRQAWPFGLGLTKRNRRHMAQLADAYAGLLARGRLI